MRLKAMTQTLSTPQWRHNDTSTYFINRCCQLLVKCVVYMSAQCTASPRLTNPVPDS